jgi:hypothetical protein
MSQFRALSQNLIGTEIYFGEEFPAIKNSPAG